MSFFKKNKNIILAAVIIIALLLITFFMGDKKTVNENGDIKEITASETIETDKKVTESIDEKKENNEVLKKEETNQEEKTNQEDKEIKNEEKADTEDAKDEKEKEEPHEKDKNENVENPPVKNIIVNQKNNEQKPVKAQKENPEPIDPENASISDKELRCTISVRCDTIKDNIKKLDRAKKDIVPSDGVIFPETEVVFYEGESVFNVLLREMKKNKIHLEFVNTPLYHSAYIEGIANLYEFDCGELSGWMYRVNGWFPNYGCSRYQIKENDKIEWIYTCDLGKDIGGGESARNGNKDEE